MTPALEIEALRAGYGRGDRIAGVSLTLAAGESVCFVGLNGAGKTTLIKALTGLNRPTAGTVRLFGLDAASAAARSRFAFLPERFAPSRLLTGFEVMRLTRMAYRLPYRAAAAAGAAEPVGLPPDTLTRRVATYSKGMAQKLGLAAALYAERPLLILDEPFSGLDPLARHAVTAALTRYRAGGGTLVFTSHLLEDVARLADRVMVIHEGRAVFAGAPDAFLALSPAAAAGDAHAAFLAAIGT